MQLKKSFYHEVKDRLPEHVLEYWGVHRHYHFALNETLDQFIKRVLDESFSSITENELSDHIKKIRNTRRKRKYDWIKKYENALTYPFSDPSHPVFSEYCSLQAMGPRELSQKYQDLEEDEILRNKTELKTAQMRQWKADRNSLFTEYPAISILKQQNKEDALKSDVLDITCDYIVKELNYDMSSNSKPLPSPIVSKPFFSLRSSKITLEEIDGIMQNIIKNDNAGTTFTMYPTSSSDTQLTTLDKYDLSVYQEITRLACSDTKVHDGNILVDVSFYQISKQIFGYDAGEKGIQRVRDSIKKLSNRRFVYSNGGTQIDYVLVDSKITDEYDKNKMRLVLGKVISDSILQKDIISISKKVEEKLQSNSNARAFIHALQEQRFILYRDSPDNMKKSFGINFFEDSIYFNTKSYKKKISIIEDSLDEYVNNDVIIQNYSFDNNLFNLDFLPLDENDVEYYSEWLKNHMTSNAIAPTPNNVHPTPIEAYLNGGH